MALCPAWYQDLASHLLVGPSTLIEINYLAPWLLLGANFVLFVISKEEDDDDFLSSTEKEFDRGNLKNRLVNMTGN